LLLVLRVVDKRAGRYNAEEMGRILALRTEEEGVKAEARAAQLLVKMASSTSLRYALQLLTAAHLVSRKRKAEVCCAIR